MTNTPMEQLTKCGINPSAQRVAVATYILETEDHPSADTVWHEVQKHFPMISRATVYNTLNLFVSKGLLREYVITEGNMVFDPNIRPHHHFIDDDTGAIHDVPWDKVQVCNVESLEEYEIKDYQVVMHGRIKTKRRSKR